MSRETVGKETRSGDLVVEGKVGISNSLVAGNVLAAPRAVIGPNADDWFGRTTNVFELRDLGGLCTPGSYAVALTSNGFRNIETGKWTSFTANGEVGASQVDLRPDGRVLLRAASDFPTGSGTQPPIAFEVQQTGPVFVAMESKTRSSDDLLEAALTATYAELDDDGNTDPEHESVALFEVITALVRQVRELSSEVESLKAAVANG